MVVGSCVCGQADRHKREAGSQVLGVVYDIKDGYTAKYGKVHVQALRGRALQIGGRGLARRNMPSSSKYVKGMLDLPGFSIS